MPLPPQNRTITVGLLGGSFNPAHEGHLHISLEAIKRLGLDEVWWLVSPQNPLKPEKGMLPFEKRVKMAKTIANHPKIKISTLEKTFHTRYTYDTLLKLKRKFKHIRFVWLMGGDNLVQIPRWHKWRELAELIPIVVFDRGNYTNKALKGLFACCYAKNQLRGRNIRLITDSNPPSWGIVRMRQHPASATEIRKTLDKNAY